MLSEAVSTSDYQFEMKIPPGLSLDEARTILRPYNEGEPFDGRHFRVICIDERTRVAKIQSEPENEAYLRDALPVYIEVEAEKMF